MLKATQKQSIGIDVSCKDFAACYCLRDFHEGHIFSDVHTFSNDKHGFNQFMRWVAKTVTKGSETIFLMEATGVYHQELVYHLHKLKKKIVVALPNKTRNFFKSLNIKSKTDELDAKVLSRFALEREHQLWQPPSESYKKLRELTRHYKQLQEQRTSVGNILHSNETAFEVDELIKESNKAIIKVIDSRIDECVKAIKKLISEDEEIKSNIGLLTSIKGVGMLTAAITLAETDGFHGFSSSKQLVSFAGFDVVHFESGTSVKRKSHISKKGNKYIRGSLYFPGMAAVRHNKKLKDNYARIRSRGAEKMVGQVAVQRKLLVLMYTIWKTKTPYDPNYKKVAPAKAGATQDTTSNEMVP